MRIRNKKRLGVIVPAALAFVALGLLATTGAFAGSKTDQGKGGGKVITICPDYGDWYWDGTQWVLPEDGDETGSVKIDLPAEGLDPSNIPAPDGYEIVGFCAKAGTQTDVEVDFDNPVGSIDLSAEFTKDVSHFSLRFRKITDEGEGQWCSPGFWKNDYEKFGALQWPTDPNTPYNSVINDPTVDGNPSLATVVSNPQIYGGEATNAVATYLSLAKGWTVEFDENGDPIHNCPINHIRVS